LSVRRPCRLRPGRLEELQLALGLAEGVARLEGCDVDVAAGQFFRKLLERPEGPPFDLLLESVELRILGEIDEQGSAVPDPKEHQPALGPLPEQAGERGSRPGEVPLMSLGAGGIADPDQTIGFPAAAGRHRPPAGSVGRRIEAVGQHEGGLAPPPHRAGECLGGGDPGVAFEEGAIDPAVELSHRLLAAGLRADAVDHLDPGEFRIEHVVVDIESEAGSAPSPVFHRPGEPLRPGGPPDDDQVRGRRDQPQHPLPEPAGL